MENSVNTISRSPLPKPHPAVVFRLVADGAVLLHMKSELYFSLNTVGATVWQNLPPVHEDVDELCATLHATYPEASAEIVRRDLMALLLQLKANGLVVAAPDVDSSA